MECRVCVRCGAKYEPASISQKYCPVCGPVVAYEKAKQRKRRAYAQQKKEREEARRQRRIDHGE